MKSVPVNRPLIKGNELNFVSDCIKSGWISSDGSYVKKQILLRNFGLLENYLDYSILKYVKKKLKI